MASKKKLEEIRNSISEVCNSIKELSEEELSQVFGGGDLVGSDEYLFGIDFYDMIYNAGFSDYNNTFEHPESEAVINTTNHGNGLARYRN